MDSFVELFFNFLFNIINAFIRSIFALPIFLLDNLFTGVVVSDFTNNFYSVLNAYVIPTAGWFTQLVPPMTWNLLVLYFSFNISLYSVVLVTHYIIKPLTIVKKLVPFS